MKNKSDVTVMMKEAGILFVITLVAGILLGFVHELTREPIRLQKEKAVQEACTAAFSDVEGAEFKAVETEWGNELTEELAGCGVEIGTVYEALQNGTCCGYVVESVTSRGYGGDIVLYVGIAADGTVSGVSVLEISETVGLGMEAPKVLTPQFAGRKVNQFSYTKTGSRGLAEVDAISGATVTTEAVVNAVNGALRAAQDLLQGGVVNE